VESQCADDHSRPNIPNLRTLPTGTRCRRETLDSRLPGQVTAPVADGSRCHGVCNTSWPFSNSSRMTPAKDNGRILMVGHSGAGGFMQHRSVQRCSGNICANAAMACPLASRIVTYSCWPSNWSPQCRANHFRPRFPPGITKPSDRIVRDEQRPSQVRLGQCCCSACASSSIWTVSISISRFTQSGGYGSNV